VQNSFFNFRDRSDFNLRCVVMVRLGVRQFGQPFAAWSAVYLHRVSWRKI
ncbi:MAG: hypothetical protein AVDCRST_MAG74-1510, partial [uncultured Pyrinomonadaceae bacterium]